MAVAAIGAVLLASQAGPTVAGVPAPCEAAKTLLPYTEFGNDKVLYSDAFPEAWKPRLDQSAWDGWRGEAPPRALIERFVASPLQSVTSCGAAASPVVSERVAAAEVEAMRADAPATWLVRMSRPVVNRSGDAAIAAVASSGNRLGGSTTLLFLRKSGGSWAVAGQRIVSLS